VSFVLTHTLQVVGTPRSTCCHTTKAEIDTIHMTSIWRQESPYHCDYGGGAGVTTNDGRNGADDTTNKSSSWSSSSSSPYSFYPASCFCGRVKYEVRGDPESAKFCHCRGCQQLHGAPFEWVGSFLEKLNVFLGMDNT
jgi:hypothetical protein